MPLYGSAKSPSTPHTRTSRRPRLELFARTYDSHAHDTYGVRARRRRRRRCRAVSAIGCTIACPTPAPHTQYHPTARPHAAGGSEDVCISGAQSIRIFCAACVCVCVVWAKLRGHSNGAGTENLRTNSAVADAEPRRTQEDKAKSVCVFACRAAAR